MRDMTIHRVFFNHFYTSPSYADFFSRYDPYRDGEVIAATYSFRHDCFDFWSKLMPFSTMYVDTKYHDVALAFLRRFPLFRVFTVRHLHRKVVFFTDSGVLYLGSENFYSRNADFAELMVETVVPKTRRSSVVESVFGDLHGKPLTCQYGLSDIRIHGEYYQFLHGFPCLPCHREITYWDRLSNTVGPDFSVTEKEQQTLGRVYVVVEYDVAGEPDFVCFGRGYDYCGNLSPDAAVWLLTNCEIIHEASHSFWSPNHEPVLLKDKIFRYHPIMSKYPVKRSYWLGKVTDLDAHKAIVENIVPQEITHLKIRRGDA